MGNFQIMNLIARKEKRGHLMEDISGILQTKDH